MAISPRSLTTSDAALRTRLVTCLHQLGVTAATGARVSPRREPDLDLQPAAVLVPLLLGGGGPKLLLTVRTQTLKDHPGQISFPGGRRHATDGSAEQTALRECQEEIGINTEAIELLGRLPDCETVTGFRITPVVGLLAAPPRLRLSPVEVAATLSVPLSFLLDFSHLEQHCVEDAGQPRDYFVYQYETHRIWGATAAIIVDLCRRLRGEPA